MADDKATMAEDAEDSGEGSARTPEIVLVFLDAKTLLEHFRVVADAINGNAEIKNLKSDLPAVTISKKKNGFTRHLFMGDLDAQPFEYTLPDWDVATQHFKHLPDVVWRRKPGLMIVCCEDSVFPAAVIRSAYAGTGRDLTVQDLHHLDDAIKQDLRFGDVAIYRRDGYSEDDPSGVFSVVFSTRE